MSEFFFSVDLAVFYFFNRTLSCAPLDRIFGTLTNVNNWFLLYFFLMYLIVRKYKKAGILLLLAAAVMIVVTDQTGFRVLKEFFARPRPFKSFGDVLLPVGPSGTYSFPSNHAINNFAVAAFFSSVFPGYRTALFTLASLVAVSRVYVGVHYPSDVIGGAILGAAFGYLFSLLYRLLAEKFGVSIESRQSTV